MSTSDTRPAVTVVGLGPMGQAMARTFLASGHPVTVWNRTPGRADALVAEGAHRAATPEEAVAAADLVVLSLTDYQAMYDILGTIAPPGQGTDVLDGTTLVNLSSDTPGRTRDAAAWAERRGARFLTGGVMVPAPMVGSEGAYAYYSGPRDVLDAHDATLRRLGDVRYVGEDPGLAQLWYQAQLDVFLTTLASLLHATALVGAAGVPAAEFLPKALETVTGIPAMLGAGEDTARNLASGNHPGDLSTTTMMGATADHIVATSTALAVDATLPEAVQSLYARAVAAGHGRDNWTSLYEVVKAPAAA